MNRVFDELIELRGLRFHYRDWTCAKRDAPPLVLLHGFTGHARSWDTLAEALASDYRVFALDQRGHGESAWAPPDAYGALEMVADLEAFVAALRLRSFALLGLSMGGNVAMHYAGRRPRELERLVIVDIGPEIAQAGLARIQSNVQAPDRFSSKEAAFARARSLNPRPPEALLRHRSDWNLMRTSDGDWTYRYDRVLRDPTRTRERPSVDETWRAAGNIDVPTLLIRGAESDILDADVAKRMIDTIPDARLVEIADSGHSIPLDAPDALLGAVRTFL